MYDVMRTDHLQLENPRKFFTTLGIGLGRHGGVLLVVVSPPQIILAKSPSMDDNPVPPRRVAAGNQVPKVGEWTRIEISHKKEEGKYFLSLAVGGEQVGREEVNEPALHNPTDVKLSIGCYQGAGQGRAHPLPGFVRRVVVVHK